VLWPVGASPSTARVGGLAFFANRTVASAPKRTALVGPSVMRTDPRMAAGRVLRITEGAPVVYCEPIRPLQFKCTQTRQVTLPFCGCCQRARNKRNEHQKRNSSFPARLGSALDGSHGMLLGSGRVQVQGRQFLVESVLTHACSSCCRCRRPHRRHRPSLPSPANRRYGRAVHSVIPRPRSSRDGRPGSTTPPWGPV
jgi:hypothetical protein